MTKKELKNIEKFTIYNEYGSIEYQEKVDVSSLDVDHIVDIRKRKIEVYPKKHFKKEDIPEVGVELNKKAVITLKYMKPKKN